jgi:hypothetical protein
MTRILREGFSDTGTSFGTGIRLTRTAPVLIGEPVLTVDVPDDVVQRHGQEVRSGEFVFSPDVLNWYAVTHAGR